jgi:hypothetical protein
VEWLLVFAPGIAAATAGLWLLISPSRSRQTRLVGLGFILLAGLQAVGVVAWFLAACWETWQPCEGEFLGSGLMEVGYAVVAIGCVLAALGTPLLEVRRALRERDRSRVS